MSEQGAEMRTYTAEQLDHIAGLIDQFADQTILAKDEWPAVAFALRIAERVMTPGVIEESFMEGFRQRGTGKQEVAAAIRSALTKTEGRGLSR